MSGFFLKYNIDYTVCIVFFHSYDRQYRRPCQSKQYVVDPQYTSHWKCMERRAGEVVEKVAGMSTLNAAKEAFEMEMQ